MLSKKFFRILLLSVIVSFLIGNAEAQNEFITEWDLSKTGSGATQIKFNVIKGSGGDIAYSWRELPTGTSVTGNISASGTFTLTDLPANGKIELKLGPANLEAFAIGDVLFSAPDRERLVSVTHWGTAGWTTFNQSFRNCSNMNVTATDKPDLSNATDIAGMFYLCTSLTGNSSFSSWNTSGVENISSMFYGATSFNQPIGSWDVSKVTNMSWMFGNATSFNQPIGSWDVSKVTNMYSVFYGATSFNQPIANWDVSNVETMYGMFASATAFNQPIGKWDVSKVNFMVGMFASATAFNNPSPGDWTLRNHVNLAFMFDNSGLDCNSYGLILRGWANNPNTPLGIYLTAANIKYGSAYSGDRSKLADPISSGGKGWSFNDGGQATSCPPLPVSFGNIEAYAKDGMLYVNWATLSEKNNLKFEIEASKDGAHFTKIGEVLSQAKDGDAGAFSYSYSKPVAGMAFAGFAFLGMAIGAALLRRKKLMLTMLVVAVITLSFSCAKHKKEVVQKTDENLYVRIAQVDKDGMKNYSKVVKVERRQ